MNRNILSIWRKRGLPRSVAGIAGCRGSYSQCGEDMILASIFDREHCSGLYLDLGCYHPIQWSNTYHFYLRGWRGVTVDASPCYTHLWKRHRPGDIHWCSAVVPTRQMFVKEYVQTTGHAATHYCVVLDREGECMAESGAIRALAIEDLAKWWPFSQPPDFISTDLEGLDLDVWAHFPFSEFSPRAIVLEAPTDTTGMTAAMSLLERVGYAWVARCGLSLVFQRTESSEIAK